MDLVVLSALRSHVIAVRSGVVKAAHVTEVTHGANALVRAKRIAAQMQKRSDEALAAAREKGLSEGRALAAAEYAEKLAKVQAARQAVVHEIKPILVDIVMQAVETLLRKADRRELFAAASSSVDSLTRQARWARLRVHPSMVGIARQALGQDAEGNNASQQAAVSTVGVVADMDIDVDGCIFETDAGIADSSLNVQLDALRNAVQIALGTLPGLPDAAVSVLP